MVLVKIKTIDDVEVLVERTTIRKSKMIIEALNTLVFAANPNATSEQLDELRMNYENPEPIPLKFVTKSIFDNVLKWCEQYKQESDHIEDDTNEKKLVLSDWDEEFLQSLSNRALLDLLIAADFLGIAKLRLHIAIKCRDKVRGIGPEEIRRIFAK